MNRTRLAVFACLVPILAASMSRVAATFALYTTPIDGWLAAFGIDVAVALLTWRIMDGERRAAHRWALAGVVLASIVSAQANLAANAATVAGQAALAAGGWPLSILATVSVTMPVLVGILAAVAHGDAKVTPARRTATRTEAPTVAVTATRVRTPRPARPPATAKANEARAIAAAEPGLQRAEIARRLGVHPSTVGRALAGMDRNGASAG